jgi:hypothetical protein
MVGVVWWWWGGGGLGCIVQLFAGKSLQPAFTHARWMENTTDIESCADKEPQ